MIQYTNLFVPEEELISIRKAVYHSNGNGYFVFRNFITESQVKHLVDFWVNEVSEESVNLNPIKEFRKEVLNRLNAPNYSVFGPAGDKFFNFFWNTPLDEFTHSVSFYIQILRNQVSGRNVYEEFFPTNGHACTYRVVRTLSGESIVKPHRDWNEGEDFDPSRLQATLILSKKGADYEGKGMIFETNSGHTISFDSPEMPLEKGDLVFWKYNNLHAVEDIKTTKGQVGFFRILFPPERIHGLKKYSLKNYAHEFLKRIFRK